MDTRIIVTQGERRECEYCGLGHKIDQLCSAKPRWSRRGFISLVAAGLAGLALPAVPQGIHLIPGDSIFHLDIELTTISAQYIPRPDVYTVGFQVFQKLKAHPDVVDMIRYRGSKA